MEFLNFNSVELLPNAKASAAFTVDSGKVFSVTSDLQSEVNEYQGLRPVITSTYIRGLQIPNSILLDCKSKRTKKELFITVCEILRYAQNDKAKHKFHRN